MTEQFGNKIFCIFWSQYFGKNPEHISHCQIITKSKNICVTINETRPNRSTRSEDQTQMNIL